MVAKTIFRGSLRVRLALPLRASGRSFERAKGRETGFAVFGVAWFDQEPPLTLLPSSALFSFFFF